MDFITIIALIVASMLKYSAPLILQVSVELSLNEAVS